ncbi:DDT domain-containing protein PTM [Bienertia sinuspersici]
MDTPVVKSRGRPRKRRREDSQNDRENVNGNGDAQGMVKINDCNKDDNNDKEDVKNTGNMRKRGRPPKRRAIEIRGEAMVGRYVLKEFEENGVFLGKIVSYDSGLYRVDYEDGDCEDLDSGELREYLVVDERQKFVGEMLDRKKKLDENVAQKSAPKSKTGLAKGDAAKSKTGVAKGDAAKSKTGVAKGDAAKSKTGVAVEDAAKSKAGVAVEDAVKSVDVVKANVGELINTEEHDFANVRNDTGKVEVPKSSEPSDEVVVGSEVDDEDDVSDSSSDACEYGQGWDTRSEIEIPSTPPPDLPLSSGTIGVPEEYVSHLFSVYGFLRSFSIRLFLSPFTLDDLVGCLNCTVPTTLLDAIHVALLRALRRHLEAQASDGSELASKCLRCIDWSLLDILTWPVYLVHYLMVMGHLNQKEWKGFYIDVLQKDYCTLSVGMKLMVLQILCDDALDTSDMRTEIDIREESEVGVDSDGIALNPLESGPRKVYPRSAKTSIGKDRENINPEPQTNIGNGNGKVQETRPDNIGDDVNGDECRLCGMDGVLLCCDGCPSAYHSRCIGVNKLSIPVGEWFCHECKISRYGPSITIGTSLRGAKVFGVDPYAQLFLGTCNHLLAESICQAILKYWELPQACLPPPISTQTTLALEKKHDDFMLAFAENGNQVLSKVELENYASGTRESTLNNVSGSCTDKFIFTLGSDDVSLGAPIQNGIAMSRTNGPTLNETSTIMSIKPSEPAEVFYSSVQGLDASMTGITSCSAGYRSSTGPKNGVCLPGNLYVHRKEESNEASGKAAQQQKDNCLYMGSIFKPHTYINHYVHGDFAASAAANFAALSSDENRPSEVHASDPRKAMAANVTLQSKAFSSAATRFFWPSTEKKLIEIPRERCSWCLHCKAPVTSKKACLLNQAALNATRLAMKFCSGLKLVKNVEGGLYGIAAYMLYLEESLRGLIVGPFQSTSYQKQWRKQVEQASTCSEMKSLLLELEENLCTNALSSEWTKLVDNWMDESSVPQSAGAVSSVQKRGTGRRKKHLATPEVIADDSSESLSDLCWKSGKLPKLVFQRGTIPSSILRKAARQGGSRRIPGIFYAEGSDVPKRSRQFIWRAAVQMSMNASGLALQMRCLDYHIKWSDLLRPDQYLQDGKGPETEAFAFRNARICGKKVAENKIMYGVVFGHQKHLSSRLMKSIIEKEESDDGTKYWLYESRIPLYLIKEYEENAEKTYLPPPKKPDRYSKRQKRQLKASRKRATFLYLFRRRDDMQMCLCASCHRDVLLGVSVMCSACEGFCHKACTISSTVMTNDDVEFVTSCKQCSRGKAITQNNGAVESPTSPLVVQGQEYQHSAGVSKSARLKVTSKQYQNSMTASKNSRAKTNGKASASVGMLESLSDKKTALSDINSSKSKKRPCHWGLIWKKPCDGDGSEFRSKNIVFRGTSHGVNISPECQLCQKPYAPHLMYIRCETCQHWHHADAVELDESRLSFLVGYKCCRCRRIKTPACPYADKSTKKPEIKKIRVRGPKEETVLADSVSEAMSEPAESLPSTPMSLMEDDVYIEFDDPLLLSVSKVEQIPEPKEVHHERNPPFGSGPQKLPIRRHIKNERDDDGLIWGDYSAVQLPTSDETKNIPDTLSEWDVPNGGLEDGAVLDYENFNFENSDYEPQTYFSFTELLEADDANQFGVDVCGDAWENLSCEYSQSGFPEHCEMGSFDGHVSAPSMGTALDVSCNICLQTAPVPDLACHICGLQIHSQCSPGEDISQGNIWMCANCRGWR